MAPKKSKKAPKENSDGKKEDGGKAKKQKKASIKTDMIKENTLNVMEKKAKETKKPVKKKSSGIIRRVKFDGKDDGGPAKFDSTLPNKRFRVSRYSEFCVNPPVRLHVLTFYS